jgi:hypothetical protein
MRRFLTALAVPVAVACALPALASAEVIEVGTSKDPAVTPSCPGKPCLAVSRTTGFQAKVGTERGLMTIPKSGRIVAWSINLGKPGPTQVDFFNKTLGGASQAGISILRPGKKLFSRVMGVSPLIALEPFFGGTAQFPLVRSIPVHKGWVVALTVPTWAPALAVGLAGDTSWRASRTKDKCDDTQTQTAQTAPNDLAQYFCLYRTARLTYSATLVPYATRTNKPTSSTGKTG